MGNKPRVGPTEPSRMMDAEQRLHVSMRPDRQERLKIGPDWAPVSEMLDKSRNARRFKQAADRYLNIKARADAADQTRRKQRMAPKRKEVVVDPNTLDTQNLRKQPAQQLLLRRARHTPKPRDRKSTRLNSSHQIISYAVF